MINQIHQWKFQLKSESPVRIGDGEADIMTDFNGKPFLPGTSWAGACREFVERNYGTDMAIQLFGDHERKSQDVLLFSDGICVTEQPLDVRKGIEIDRFSNTAKKNHLFERVTLLPGVEFSVQLTYKTNKSEEHQKTYEKKFEIVKSILQALYDGDIRLGAYQSIGGGKFTICQCRYIHYDCTTEEGLENYVNQSGKGREWTFSSKTTVQNTINISLKGETDSPLLIGDQYVNDSKKTDKTFITTYVNGKKQPIIPASSIKGALRSRVERIANVLQLPNKERFVAHLFGSYSKESNKRKGALQLEDIPINIDENKSRKTYYRIAINPLTGGIKDGMLLNEETITGPFKTTFKYRIEEKEEDLIIISLYLLLFALRDFALQQVTIGSGSSIGRGNLKIHSIAISNKDREVLFDMRNNHIQDSSNWLAELQQKFDEYKNYYIKKAMLQEK